MSSSSDAIARTPRSTSSYPDASTLLRGELVDLLDHLTQSRDGRFPSAIPGLSINRLSTPQIPQHLIHDPVFSVIAQGAKRLSIEEEVYEYDPMHYLISSVDMPVLAQVTTASRETPYLGLRLDLDIDCLGTLIQEAEFSAGVAEEASRGLYVGTLDDALLDATVRLLRLLESPQDIPVMAPMIQREILYRLLRSGQGARLRQIALKDSQTHRIARAIRLVKERFAEPLAVVTLAEAAHMSVSSLHHHFKAMTAMSPLQFQKRLRLQEARRLLMVETLEITAVAQRVGYESPSQFSREYRRLFGLPPQRDRQRWRQEPA